MLLKLTILSVLPKFSTISVFYVMVKFATLLAATHRKLFLFVGKNLQLDSEGF